MEHKELYQGFIQDQKAFEKYMVESGKITVDQINEQRAKVKDLEEKLIKDGEVEEGEYVFERYMLENGMITLEEIRAQRKRDKNTSMEENEKLKDQAKQMQDELVGLVVEGAAPDSFAAQDFLDRNYDLFSKQKFMQVATFYLKASELRKVWDDLHPDLADFVNRASKVYAARYGLEI